MEARTARIAPAVLPGTGTLDANDVVYELACRRVLPSLDGRKCVKNVVLRGRALRRFNGVLHYTKPAFPVLYPLALASGLVALLAPRTTVPTKTLSLVSLLCATPSHLAAFASLRFDMAVLVCKTFEFWYATVMNVICMTLICITLNDVRALVAISSAIGHQVPFFIDAVYRAPRVAIAASAYGSLANVCYTILLVFRLLPDCQHVVLVTLLDRQLTSNVVISNGLFTISLLLARNAYRKYQIVKKFSKDSAGRFIGSSIAYRCCVQLRPIDQQSLPPSATLLNLPSTHTIQLVFDGSSKHFSARDVLFPPWLKRLSLRPWHRVYQAGLLLAGLTGLVALAVSHLPQALIPDFGYHTEICVTAFAGTVVFVAVYVAHCQRQLLLYELGRSFDFLFIGTQSLLAHLCVCELYRWDIRCFGVASSFLWSLWIIILDAVTPVMRCKLCFHKNIAIAVGGVLVFEQASFVLDLVVFGSLKLHERELFSLRLSGYGITVTVLPTFLGRVVLTFLWYSRVAWRIFERHENELLVLQGQLQYEDRELRRRATVTNGPRSTLAVMLATTSWRTTSVMISSTGSRRGPVVANLTH